LEGGTYWLSDELSPGDLHGGSCGEGTCPRLIWLRGTSIGVSSKAQTSPSVFQDASGFMDTFVERVMGVCSVGMIVLGLPVWGLSAIWRRIVPMRPPWLMSWRQLHQSVRCSACRQRKRSQQDRATEFLFCRLHFVLAISIRGSGCLVPINWRWYAIVIPRQFRFRKRLLHFFLCVS